MGLRILLDTNAYVEWKRGHDEVDRLIRVASRIYLSTVVAGELMFGFRNGNRFDKNLAELREFIENPYVELLAVTLETADRFGRVAASLRRRGTPIPQNDIWVAAHTLECGAELVSLDQHFKRVEGLAVIHPVGP